MLTSLRIKDFAIIDEIELSLGTGLNVMTGETGAGKTIIVEALKLVLGGRASAEAVRAGSESASVTATFDSSDLPAPAANALADAGIECKEGIIVHRVVGSQGKGRISINGVPVIAATLKTVAEHLVDISSQHEHQLMLDEARYPALLDGFAGLWKEFEAFALAHRMWLDVSRELAKLEDAGRNAVERQSFLKFQLDEIERAQVKPGEDAEIEAELKRLKHAVFLEEKVRAACDALSGEAGSAISALSIASHAVEQCAQFESKAEDWAAAINRSRVEAEEVARELSIYAERVGSEPDKAEQLEERMYLIRGLTRKHGGSIEALLARGEEMAQELRKIENYDGERALKRVALDESALARRTAAQALSRGRTRAAREMGKSVASELCELGMKKSEFSIKVEQRPEEEWDESGPDRVEFLISPNVGEPMRGLARIASGGELSRFMLALKSALVSKSAQFGTSIFDEVDSGIGGAVAAVVGRKLKAISQARQVVCITHLPQVAAFADSHVRISKRVKAGRTVTSMDGLAGDDRVNEIARMLGGEKITDTTIAHAREMLRESGS
ncbi:MAG: DNA repair protein RecN [bacterium]